MSFAKGNNITTGTGYDTYPSWIANVLLSYQWDQRLTFSLANRVALDRKTWSSENTSDLEGYYRTDFNVRKILSDQIELRFDIRNFFNNNKLVRSNVLSETWEPEQGVSARLSGRYSF